MTTPAFTPERLIEIEAHRNAVSSFDSDVITWLNETAEALLSNETIKTLVDFETDDRFLDDTPMVANDLHAVISGIVNAADHYTTVDPSDGEVQTYDHNDIEYPFYIPNKYLLMSRAEFTSTCIGYMEAWVAESVEDDEDE